MFKVKIRVIYFTSKTLMSKNSKKQDKSDWLTFMHEY